MSSRQRTVEKHRLRRRKKKRSAIRSASLHHQQALATDRYPFHKCVVNKYWRDDGVATVLLARRIAPGRLTMGIFLVDTWAMGLKDAWGRVDISVSEFDETVSKFDAELEKCTLDLETARHLVYGGIELARDLGFRLPRKYERWTAILGPLPAGVSPDMSLFLKDGKIMLACSMRELEERLVTCKVEDFLERSDVSYVLAEDDFTLVEHEADEFDDTMLDMEQAFVDSVKKWCFANRQVPHPLLPEAVSATLEVISQDAAVCKRPDGTLPDPSDQELEGFVEKLQAYVMVRTGHHRHEVLAAVGQIAAYMDSTGTPQDFFKALGMEK